MWHGNATWNFWKAPFMLLDCELYLLPPQKIFINMMCIPLGAVMVVIKASRPKQSSVVLYDTDFNTFITPVPLDSVCRDLICFWVLDELSLLEKKGFHLEMVNQLCNMDLFLTHALLVSSLSSPHFFIAIFFHFSMKSTTFQCMIESEMSYVDTTLLPNWGNMAKIAFQSVCVHSQKEDLPRKMGQIKLFLNPDVGKTEGIAAHHYSERVERIFSRLKEDHGFIKFGLAQAR